MVGNLLQGNCLELMKDIPDKSVDMILCDLPFGITQNGWDSVLDFDTLWSHYNRIIKPAGVVVLFSSGIFTARVVLSNSKAFKYKIVWVKSKATNFLNVSHQPLRKHEDICVFYNKRGTYNAQKTTGEPYDKGFRADKLTDSYGSFDPSHIKSEDGMRQPTDVIYFTTAECEGVSGRLHPTQKPVKLLENLIKTYTNEGDIVLDNCMGVGSTGIACLNTNRSFIGMELDDKYFELAKERISSHV